jgi:signal peptidase II
VLGLALDLLTKVWSFKALLISMWRNEDGRIYTTSETYAMLPGWLHFSVTVNQGAVFGMGQGQRWLFVSVSVVALAFLSYLFATSRRTQRIYQVLLGMLLAGVLGNLYDRIRFGYVRDMIHSLPGWKWPGSWNLGGYPGERREVFPFIFNVADVLLCVGVGLMIVYSLFAPDPAKKKDASTEAAPAK